MNVVNVVNVVKSWGREALQNALRSSPWLFYVVANLAENLAFKLRKGLTHGWMGTRELQGKGLERVITIDVHSLPRRGASGPRTELGKQRSKLNAVKHEIFSGVMLLGTHDPEAHQPRPRRQTGLPGKSKCSPKLTVPSSKSLPRPLD